MKSFGIFLIFLSLLINALFFIFLDTHPFLNKNQQSNFYLFSQFAGASALILMAYTQIIATRLTIIEKIFGAMDQSYRLHKWLGISALIAFYTHEMVDAKTPYTQKDNIYEIAKFLGEQGLNGLTILIVLSVLLFIPYHWWRWTHRFIGIFFILCVFHFLLISKPFSLNSYIGWYISSFCLFGVLAFIYTQLPISMKRWHSYRVTKVDRGNQITKITLSPQTKGIKHQAGQFAFLKISTKETHPFTISTAPNLEKDLRFSIKALGDFTKKLPSIIKEGDNIDIQGGYGRFIRRQKKQTEIWIAGGIGITPFIAWAENLKNDDPASIHLFYCVKSEQEAIYIDLLRATSATYNQFNLHLIDSGTMPKLTAATINKTVGNLSKSQIYFCGPSTMRDSLKTQLKEYGVSQKRYHYEAFEIRTGIGIDKIFKKYTPNLFAKVTLIINLINNRLNR